MSNIKTDTEAQADQAKKEMEKALADLKTGRITRQEYLERIREAKK